MTHRAVAAGLLFVCAGVLAQAEEPAAAPVKGRFESGDIGFDVRGAYAFHAKASMGDEQVIVVAISNAAFQRAIVDRWWDRKQALEKRFKDADTALVYFEFSPSGEYQSINYYLASGNGCGYCSGGVTSTVKLVAGKLTGTLSTKGKERSFDLSLDVPVSGDEHGTALPAGGGGPAKAYLAYHEALKANDATALAAVLDEFLSTQLAKAQKAKDVAGFMQWLSGERYVDTVRVEKGFAAADHAVLLVTGEGPIGKRRGQVVLLPEKAGWRVSDEVLEMAGE